MKFVVYGAGAIGGVVGARLFQHGHDVSLVARGPHAEAIRGNGLRLETPDGAETLPIPIAEPTLPGVTGPVVALIAVKSQDTASAVRDLEGILDLGRFPVGVDDLAVSIAGALGGSSFLSEPRPDIMRWKYRKLVMNLGNAVQALCGQIPDDDPVLAALRREADHCYAAAGIAVTTVEEDGERRADQIRRRPVPARRRSGGSSYQSLARRQGSIETDYLNGEICLLGRQYDIATPVNTVVQRLANQAARERWAPGRLKPAELAAAVEAALTSS